MLKRRSAISFNQSLQFWGKDVADLPWETVVTNGSDYIVGQFHCISLKTEKGKMPDGSNFLTGLILQI